MTLTSVFIVDYKLFVFLFVTTIYIITYPVVNWFKVLINFSFTTIIFILSQIALQMNY